MFLCWDTELHFTYIQNECTWKYLFSTMLLPPPASSAHFHGYLHRVCTCRHLKWHHTPSGILCSSCVRSPEISHAALLSTDWSIQHTTIRSIYLYIVFYIVHLYVYFIYIQLVSDSTWSTLFVITRAHTHANTRTHTHTRGKNRTASCPVCCCRLFLLWVQW